MKASKHRPTVATVDLDAIAFNVQQVSRHIPSQTLKYAVVKANAYGHGVSAVTKKLVAQVDGFCVSNMDEALEIREEGLDHPILILGVVPTETVDLAKKYDIRLTVASLAWLKHLLAEEPDLSGLKVHIKVDSGMGRIGFRKIEEIKEAEGLLLAAGAEIPILRQQMKQMIGNFKTNTAFSKKYWLLLKPFLRLFTLAILPPLCGMQIRFSQLYA